MKQRTKRQKHQQPENHGKAIHRLIQVSRRAPDGSKVYPDDDESDQISEEAALATIDLNPTDLPSLNRARVQFANAFAKAARRHGYTEVMFEDEWIEYEKPNWKPYNDELRRKYYDVMKEQSNATNVS